MQPGVERGRAVRLAAGAMLAGLVALSLAAAFHGEPYRTVTDPTGEYTARITYRRYLSWIPMMPGGGNDKPGFVEVFQRGKGSLGRIPVPLLQLADVRWEPPGAVVKGIGEWDFDRHTCFYWNESQDHRIWVRGGP